MIISKHEEIRKDDLPREFFVEPSPSVPSMPLREAVLEFKRETVIRVLNKAGGKKSKAAEMLGLPRSNFSRLMKNLGMR